MNLGNWQTLQIKIHLLFLFYEGQFISAPLDLCDKEEEEESWQKITRPLQVKVNHVAKGDSKSGTHAGHAPSTGGPPSPMEKEQTTVNTTMYPTVWIIVIDQTPNWGM